MIVLVIRKGDSKVMPLRQNSPNPKPGRMAANTAKQFGGNASDYTEYIVPPEDEDAVMAAKDLIYNPADETIDIIERSNKEKGLLQKEPELEGLEEQLIKMHIYETAATDLGLNAQRYTARKTSLQSRIDRLRQEIEDLENEPDGDG